MTPTNFDVDILKKKSFYKLPSSALLGNALFAHVVKFLYNSSKENGIVICSRAFKVRTSKTFVRQVRTHTCQKKATSLIILLQKNSSPPFSKVGLLKLVVRQEAESENPTILRVTWLPSRHGGDFFPAEMTNIILPHYSSCAFLLSCSVTSLLGSTLIVRVTFRASCF